MAKNQIDLYKLSYTVYAKDSGGNKHNVTGILEELGWDENENELSTKISFKVMSKKTKHGTTSQILKPGNTVLVYANVGSGSQEVTRGKILHWKNSRTNETHGIEVVAYDDLYNLQMSQDYFLFASGKTAKARIKQILGKWGVPLGKYQGPTCRLGKKKYEAKYLSDIILDILKKGGKKDGAKYIFRGTKGKAEVIKRGSNSRIYVFDVKNTIMREKTADATDMVTKVKIVSKTKKAKVAKTVAVVKGDTKKFGTLQQIYNKDDDESVSEAKKTAKGIIKRKGKIQREGQVKAPDVPFLRKGDKIKMNFKTLKGYYYVTRISHDADTKTMTMTIKK